MGNREYGVLVKTRDDLMRLKAMVEEHNRQNEAGIDTGSEELTWGPAILHRGKVYVCLHSGGGHANEWLWKYQKEHGFLLSIYLPWMKPSWWDDAPTIPPAELKITKKNDAELRDELCKVCPK
ncbi:hypothetical protein Ndes2526B_g04020 [Nannochloris sp. 'desiccata']|nr:hypothetical protein NADE_009253 [Chlorella desiccata (nom. nud.)]